MQAKQDHAELRRAEAARYALLRRLALAMRHQMVVHLQPIGMITELMERRLQEPEPDLAQIGDSMDKIQRYSRAAVEASLNVVSWLAPEPGSRVAVDAGVDECVALLRSNFSFRGLTLRNEVGSPWPEVSRSGVRTVLAAVLFALSDQAVSPAEIVITCSLMERQARLEVTVRPSGGEAGFEANAPYRLLQWPEVEALAEAEGASVTREGQSARILLPLG